MDAQLIRTLIDASKENFIMIKREKNMKDVVFTTTKIEKGQVIPMTLDTSRVIRAQKIMKIFPLITNITGKGGSIGVDVISKIMSFTPNDDFEGIIQYQYDRQRNYYIMSIFDKIIQPQKDIFTYDGSESEYSFNILKVFSVVLNRGSMISINDGIEKVLHISLIEPTTGLIGQAPDYNTIILKLNIIKNIWPEIGIMIIIKNDNVYIHSNLLKEQYKVEDPCFLQIRRNLKSKDISISVTHMCHKLI